MSSLGSVSLLIPGSNSVVTSGVVIKSATHLPSKSPRKSHTLPNESESGEDGETSTARVASLVESTMGFTNVVANCIHNQILEIDVANY